MQILFISQAIAQNELNQIAAAFPSNSQITFLTGSQVQHPSAEIIQTTRHNTASLKGRLMCWIGYESDVRKWARANKGRKFDLIYGISNPPLNAHLGLWLKKYFSAPFVYMNWDLYPQIIEGTYDNILIRLICKCWHLYNITCYPKIDQMLTIGSVMADSINAPLKKKINIKIVPIACNTDVMRPRSKAGNIFIQRNALQGKFIVMYSGKLGYGHNIQCFLNAARLLENCEDILFLFIGKGSRCAEVEQAIVNGAKNVRLMPYQPEEIVPYSMASGDVGIVSQEKKIAHLFLPSKTYTMMACGMPIVGLCSSMDDLKLLLDDSNAGFAITENDSYQVADNIRRLYNDCKLYSEMSQNARAFVVDHFSESAVVAQYREVFQSVLTEEKKK
ncbi:MAG: glycosyltransferase family 4 protein [Eubacteriales bacterium]|nr:glycosyltransferase family 4 protein [Eubacteriales bacterium]